MNEVRFRRYNKAIVKHIWPFLKRFELEDATVKFTGDGWLLFHPDLNKARAIVALAKTLAAVFRKDIAAELDIAEDAIPPLRLAVCTGEDEEIELGNGQKEWVGDSARRATRASGCCGANDVIVNSTVHEKIFRAFQTQPIVISALPENRRPKRWEEDFLIYSVGELRADYLAELKYETDPADSAHYVTYLDMVGRKRDAGLIFTSVADAVVEETISVPPTGIESPADLVKRAQVASEMRKLLYSAPTSELRDEIVARMSRLGVLPAVHTFTNLIRRSESYSEAIEWFYRMKQFDVAPNQFTFAQLMLGAPDYSVAASWFESMLTGGVQPNVVVFSTMVSRSPSFDVARHWFDSMLNAGFIPDLVAYNALIARCEDISAAEECYEAMSANGVRPDQFTFNSILNLCNTSALTEKWFHIMVTSGVAPDFVTYNTLINHSPNMSVATRWLQEMRDAGIAPTNITFNTLIKLSPDIEAAATWVTAMRAAGVAPDVFTYNTLMNRSPDLPTAERLLNAMEQDGVDPDIVTYTTLIKKSSHIEDARRWVDTMRLAGFEPDDYTWKALARFLQELKKLDDFGSGILWLGLARFAGLSVDESTAAHFAGRITTVEEADILTMELERSGAFLGDAYYGAIFAKLAAMLEPGPLLGWYGKQKFKRQQALGAAVRSYALRGDIEGACRIALSFPFTSAARKVFRLHSDRAVAYFEQFLAEDFEPFNATYSLGYCYFDIGDYEKALDMFGRALAYSLSDRRRRDIEERIKEIEQAKSARGNGGSN